MPNGVQAVVQEFRATLGLCSRQALSQKDKQGCGGGWGESEFLKKVGGVISDVELFLISKSC